MISFEKNEEIKKENKLSELKMRSRLFIS